jgi:lipopolysaccharide transport system ATP-binding protein
MSAAIEVINLSKQFRRYSPHRPATVQEAVARGLRRITPVERFWALRDVSLRVMTGTTLGVIGPNGSGKSTLLRLIGGVGRADAGSVVIHGRLGALLNLNAGFHPDLTGRENAVTAGVLGGLTRRQVLARFDDIVAFADIADFIDNPVRTYSTGMQMRLAFSTAIHTDPDILLIDEVLSVGDIAFQRKCLDRIATFKASGCSIVLATHDADVVTALCDEVVWLNGGRLVTQGEAKNVVSQYLERMAANHRSVNAPPEIADVVASRCAIPD